MGTELIVCAIFLVAVLCWYFSTHVPPVEEIPQVELPKLEIIEVPETVTIEEEYIPMPQKLRRYYQMLKRKEAKQSELDEYLRFKAQEAALIDRGHILTQKELELTDLANQTATEREWGRLERKEMLIEVEGQRVELKDLLSEIQHRENLLLLEQREIKLNGLKVSLKELLVRIQHEANKVEISKRELDHQQKELEFAYREKAFELEKAAQTIREMVANFLLDKKAWEIEVQQQKLEIYHGKLMLLESTIKEMYEIRMKWLQIQAKDNALSSWEQRLRIEKDAIHLQKLYEATQSKIRELMLDRKENNLIWDRKFLEDKWRKLKEVEQTWYIGRNLK